MADSYSIYKQNQARANAPAAQQRVFASLEDMLSEPELQKIAYLLDVKVFDEKPLREESLAPLAARVGEDRTGVLNALVAAGVDDLGHRQLFVNSLTRAVREGRITRGWAKPPPEECAHCGARAAKDKKLLTCGRCKTARYCNAKCQKEHWVGGHKAECKKPDPTMISEWAKVTEGGELDEFKQKFARKIGTGGCMGGPVYADGHSSMVNGKVKDIRE